MLNNIVCAEYVPDMNDKRHKEHVNEQQAEHAGNMERMRGWLHGNAPDCEECNDSDDMEFDGEGFKCTYCDIYYPIDEIEDFVEPVEGEASEWGLELSAVWTIPSETGFLYSFYDTQDYLEFCQENKLDHDDGEIMVRFIISTGGPHDEYLLEIGGQYGQYTDATHKYLPWFAGYCGQVPHDDKGDLLDFFNQYFSAELLEEKMISMTNEFHEMQWDYVVLEEEEDY